MMNSLYEQIIEEKKNKDICSVEVGKRQEYLEYLGYYFVF